MAVSKVAYDGHTLIDLEQDTAVESDVADGKYFHKSNGERVQGTSGKVIVQGSDSSAYLIRPTAGETLAPLDCDRKSVLKKLGNTVGVNQLVPNANRNFTNTTAEQSATINFFFRLNASPYTAFYNKSSSVPLGDFHFIAQATASGNAQMIHNGMWTQQVFANYLPVVNGHTYLGTLNFTSFDITTVGGLVVKNICLFDLTLWFGSNDAIPSHLLSHPEDWGRYYAGSLAYNAGTLDSADGTVMRSIGRNCFDEQMELGSISSVDGSNQSSTTTLRSTNYIPVIPNTDYYFYAPHSTTSDYVGIRYYDASKNYVDSRSLAYPGQVISTPPNVYFMRFVMLAWYGTAYKHDITISLYYPGESGYDQYYPYTVLAEVDTGSEVLRSAGSVADEKTPDGTITRKVGYVDLGSYNYYSSTIGGYTRYQTAVTVTGATTSGFTNNGKCSRLIYSFAPIGGNATDKTIGVYNGYIYIRDDAYLTPEALKAALSGVYLYYELATPTTEQGTPFTGLQKVDGHGTEMVTGGTTGIPVPFAAQYLKTINAAPTDTIVITENGSHDVSMYAGALVNVSGGGTPSLQSKTVNLDSNAPSTVYPGTGYNGLSSVSFNTAGINASNIKSGASVCGVNGTYAGIIPSGKPSTITANANNIDVTQYAAVDVNVQATFGRSFALTYRFTGEVDDPLVKHLYYRGPDTSDPQNVVWKDIGLNADGAQYTENLTLCPMLSNDPDDYGNAIVDGFYIEGTDGSATSDITVLAGDARSAFVEKSSGGQTSTEHFYIITRGSSASIEIYLRN